MMPITRFQYQIKAEPPRLNPAKDAPSWFEPLSEPVRRVGIAAALIAPFIAMPPTPAQIEPGQTFYGWKPEWSTPVWPLKGLPAHEQQSLAFVKAAPFPETVTESRWHQPWSEPVRIKPGLTAALQPYNSPQNIFPIPTQPTVAWGWYFNLSEPVRTKPRLIESEQAFFTSITNPLVSFSWYANLTEPIRIKPDIHASRQLAFTYDLKPRVSFSWYENLSEPVRVKPRLLEGLQQFITTQPRNPIVSIAWYLPLSEPVRFKQGTSAFEQHFLEFEPRPFVSFSWFEPFSEPVRFKQGLGAWLQEAQQFRPQVISIQVTVNATETPDTLASSVTPFSTLSGAIVSIEEIVPQSAFAGVEIPLTDFAVVSIIEIKPDFAYASSVTEPTEFANVAIIEIAAS